VDRTSDNHSLVGRQSESTAQLPYTVNDHPGIRLGSLQGRDTVCDSCRLAFMRRIKNPDTIHKFFVFGWFDFNPRASYPARH
jgi:hypothetical protein